MRVDRKWVERNLGFDPIATPPPDATFASARSALAIEITLLFRNFPRTHVPLHAEKAAGALFRVGAASWLKYSVLRTVFNTGHWRVHQSVHKQWVRGMPALAAMRTVLAFMTGTAGPTPCILQRRDPAQARKRT
jgi:hypothetical protein